LLFLLLFRQRSPFLSVRILHFHLVFPSRPLILALENDSTRNYLSLPFARSPSRLPRHSRFVPAVEALHCRESLSTHRLQVNFVVTARVTESSETRTDLQLLFGDSLSSFIKITSTSMYRSVFSIYHDRCNALRDFRQHFGSHVQLEGSRSRPMNTRSADKQHVENVCTDCTHLRRYTK
jgi:hypothetical protein